MKKSQIRIDFEPTIYCCSVVLYAINAIFLLLGSCSEAVGIWLQFRSDIIIVRLTHWANRLYGEDPYDIPVLMKQSTLLFTVVGTSAYFFALVGIAGTVRRWKWVLYVYTGTLIFLLLLQAGMVALVNTHMSKFRERAKLYMMGSIQTWYRGPDAYGPSFRFSAWVDFTQRDLACCGLMGGHDYQVFNEWNHTWRHPVNGTFYVATIPFSCCKTKPGVNLAGTEDFYALAKAIKDPLCPVAPTSDNSHMNTGCYNSLVDSFSVYVTLLVAVWTVLALLELTACAAALTMAVRLHRYDDLHLNY